MFEPGVVGKVVGRVVFEPGVGLCLNRGLLGRSLGGLPGRLGWERGLPKGLLGG